VVRVTSRAVDHAFTFFSAISAPFGLKTRAFAWGVYVQGAGSKWGGFGSRVGTSGGQNTRKGTAATHQPSEHERVEDACCYHVEPRLGPCRSPPVQWQAAQFASASAPGLRMRLRSVLHVAAKQPQVPVGSKGISNKAQRTILNVLLIASKALTNTQQLQRIKIPSMFPTPNSAKCT